MVSVPYADNNESRRFCQENWSVYVLGMTLWKKFDSLEELAYTQYYPDAFLVK